VMRSDIDNCSWYKREGRIPDGTGLLRAWDMDDHASTSTRRGYILILLTLSTFQEFWVELLH
jgi:hypothetical protein